MSVFEQIQEIVKKHWSEEHETVNYKCVEEITKLLIETIGASDFDISSNHCDCGPGYEQDFYVFSWIEKGKLHTYDLLIEYF